METAQKWQSAVEDAGVSLEIGDEGLMKESLKSLDILENELNAFEIQKSKGVIQDDFCCACNV